MFPSTLSAAVAPGSVNVPPTVTLKVEFPIKVIIGRTLSTATVTDLVTCLAALPAASLTL
jgi:hypothetical protein